MSKRYLIASAVSAILLASGAAASAQSLASSPAGSPTVAPTSMLASATTVSFRVYLPLTNAAGLDALVAAQSDPKSASYHKWLTPAQLTAQFGTSPAVLAQAKAILTQAGFTVMASDFHSIDVSGSAGAVGRYLQTSLGQVQTASGHMRTIASSTPVIPTALAALGAQIFSFDPTPELHVHSKVAASNLPLNASPSAREGAFGYYWYNDLKQAYDYPAYNTQVAGHNLDGTGARVAIVMENDALNSDIQLMFSSNNFLATTGLSAYPAFTQLYTQDCFSKSGAHPAAGLYTAAPTGYTTSSGCGFNINAGSLEASLDTQMVLGGAPGASVSLVTMPGLTNSDILDAYNDIVTANTFDIVSSSFGGCETGFTATTRNQLHMVFAAGNALGITFVASSGDNAAFGCTSGGKYVLGIENPASDIDVTGVGGGNLQTVADGTLNSAYVGENGFADQWTPSENEWWGAVGGISTVTAKPAYQNLVNTGSSSFRTTPDIGLLVGGCPSGAVTPCPAAGTGGRSFVITIVQGSGYGVIGTSVAAPEFAGALALVVQNGNNGVAGAGRLGNVNTYLYTQAATQMSKGAFQLLTAYQYYHINQAGNDGYYNETPYGGYNYIFGNGSPDLRKLFGMTGYAPAGLPESSSNP